MILHTFVNQGLSASATQKQRMETDQRVQIEVRVDSGADLCRLSEGCWIGLTLA
jgi:hypothetical protein